MLKCTTCRKRQFDPSRGVICSLTGNKLASEECPQYDPDESYISTKAEIEAANDKIASERGESAETMWSTSESGWTRGFLILGVIGSIISIVEACAEARGLIGLAYLPLFALSVYAVYAFAKRKPDAVSAAITYAAVFAVDGFLGIILYSTGLLESDTSETLRLFIRNLIWSIIWIAYFSLSVNVQDLIPKETRKWGKFEKVIAGFYTLFYVLVVIGSIAG